MNLITLNIDSIPLGRPLPFALRGARGALLAQRGYVIRNRSELETLQARGVELCVDTDESGDSHRTYLHQLHQMVGEDRALGQIAKMQINARDTVSASAREREQQGPPAWLELQMRASQLLRAPQVHDFGERFHLLHEELARHSLQQPDATLLALIMLSAQETQMYSATHAMLVAVACMVTARETLHWGEQRALQVGRAALSMNIAMTALQDHLALQTDPLSWPQIMAIESHAAQSAQQLQQLGVADPLWLEAVRRHHERTPGPLADKTPAEQLARLIQRADVFGARIAPRASRLPMLATAAMQGSYYDETRQVDEAGAALVKTLGIYPPGTLVRLASQEVAVVLRRGASATTPRVAVVLSRSGAPTGEMIPRDTTLAQWKITAPVAHKDVRVSWPLERILALV
ncbi:MAG: phosphohydrolase [Comamonadaceae bacterium]|nr:phosphohydrolase [Comamonadaceae bacterium]